MTSGTLGRWGRSLAAWMLATAPVTAPAASSNRWIAPEIPVVKLSIGPGGFEPARLQAPLGAFRITVESREGDHCFAIPSLDVEKRVRAGRSVTVELAVEKAAEIPFNCCVDSTETGVLVVGKPYGPNSGPGGRRD